MITYNVSSDPARRAAQVISNELATHQVQPLLLLLAGGSALRLLDEIATESLSDTLTIMMMDERFSTDPHVNNFAQLQATTFYTKATVRGVQFISTLPTEGEALSAFRGRIEKTLRKQVRKRERPYCVALFGIGPDGHTAGIFPMEATDFVATYDDPEHMIAAVESAPNEYQERISITPAFISEYIKRAFVYAVGNNKRSILMRLDEKQPLHKLPAHIHSQIGSTLFTDQLFTS